MKTSLLLLSSLIAIALLIASPATSAEAAVKKTIYRPAITIGRETTRITEPLDRLGYVDYLAALNQKYSRGVTPENNALVLLWDVVGTEDVDDWKPKHRAQFYRLLGIKERPADSGLRVSIEDFVAGLKLTPKAASELDEKMYDDLELARSRPWTFKDFPELATLVVENQGALDFTIDATNRPRYFAPMVDQEDWPSMLSVPLVANSNYRSLARMLTLRAMRSTAVGKSDLAWRNLLACWRLGRLVGQGPWLIDGIVSLVIEGIVSRSTVQFLHHAKLSDKQLRSVRADLASLSSRPKMANRVDVCERCFALDFIRRLESEALAALPGLLAGHFTIESDATDADGIGYAKVFKRVLSRSVIDWDLVMKETNAWFDSHVAIGNQANRQERRRAGDAYRDQLASGEQRFLDIDAFLADLRTGKTPKRIVSEQLAWLVIHGLSLDFLDIYEKEYQTDMLVELVDTSIALKLYHNKHKEYPRKIEELVPVYRKAVPVDIYAKGKPVRYKKAGDGFVLYSIGLDEKDQGGPADDIDDDEDESRSDDIGFRVPAGK